MYDRRCAAAECAERASARVPDTPETVLVRGPQSAMRADQESEPESSIAPSEAPAGFCIAGTARPDDQDVVRWSVGSGAAGLWTARLEALPGQSGAVLVGMVAADGTPRTIWKSEVDRLSGTVTSPPLLLTEGPYIVVTATGAVDKPIVYRLRLEPSPALPADLPADTAVSGAFSGLLRGTERCTLMGR